MLLPSTPFVGLPHARWDTGLSSFRGRRVLQLKSFLTTVPLSSAQMTFAPYARDAELIEPFFITVGTLPTEILELSTVRPWSRPRAPETLARRAEIHQVFINPALFIWQTIALAARPFERVLP